jgi:polysaccharide biosynthesis transport protein
MAEAIDLSEEQNSGRKNAQRFLDLARRRHMHFILPVFVGWLVVWAASWILPARYKSGTLILVEQSTMPKNYVEPNIRDDLQDRLQSITQQILSRTRLLVIIDKLNLYEDKRKKTTSDEKVALMRKDIAIELVRDINNQQITAFRIYYSASDPHVAQQVTSDLTNLFIDENLKVRQKASEDTTKFIQSQLENARVNLAEQEAKIREFEGKHVGELPSQQASNLQILSGLQMQLQNEQDALSSAKQQRVYYQSLIEQYKTSRGETSTSVSSASGALTVDQELEKQREKLASLSSQYTDQHPDVQSLKKEIAKTVRMRGEIDAEMKRTEKGGESVGGSAGSSGSAGRSVPIQNASLLQLEGELRANLAAIANREQAIESLKQRIGIYQTRLNNEPARTQELAELTRGYNQSQASYDDLLKKKNGSEMATSMEQMQQGERFKILDPPSLPIKPDFPHRLKLCGIGLGVGLAFGIIVVWGFDAMDDKLYSEEEIKSLLPVAILSDIPKIVVPSEERRDQKRLALGWTMSALVVTTILAGSVFSYLHD